MMMGMYSVLLSLIPILVLAVKAIGHLFSLGAGTKLKARDIGFAEVLKISHANTL